MSRRGFLYDFLLSLLIGAAGALGGLGLGLLRSAPLVAGLDLRTDAILRSQDAVAIQLASTFLQGTLALVLPILLLVLGLVLFGLALIVHLRSAESKPKAALALLIGLVIGVILTIPILLLSDATTRAQAVLTAAGMGAGSILRAVVGPRLIVAVLVGAALGQAVGGARAASWLRRVVLGFGALFTVGGAVIALSLSRPPVLTLPPNVPELTSDGEQETTTFWVIGGSDEAVPVDLGLETFVAGIPEAKKLTLDRRNVARASKVAQALPPLHPRSAAAERLVVAGAVSEFEALKAAEGLLTSFARRGNRADAVLAASLLGRLTPTKAAIELLRRATDPEKVRVGSSAAKQLCPLAQAAGEGELVKRLSCPASAAKVSSGTIKAKITLNGRPLRRTPLGLIAEPQAQAAAWVKKGQISGDALALVAGERTGGQGEVTFEGVSPGTYLLAVSPRRPAQEAKAYKLNKIINVVVPAAGGVVELGDIEVGEKATPVARGKRPPHLLAQGPQSDEANDQLDSADSDDSGDSQPTGEGAAGDDDSEDDTEPGGDGGLQHFEKTRPATQGRTPPLPRAVKRLVALIRPAGPNKVVVPSDFAEQVLNAEKGALSPNATVSTARDKAGRPIGLELRGIRPNGVLVALGFLEGDVIENVNGRLTKEPDDLVELVDTLAGARRVRVKLKREGRQQFLNIDVE